MDYVRFPDLGKVPHEKSNGAVKAGPIYHCKHTARGKEMGSLSGPVMGPHKAAKRYSSWLGSAGSGSSLLVQSVCVAPRNTQLSCENRCLGHMKAVNIHLHHKQRSFLVIDGIGNGDKGKGEKKPREQKLIKMDRKKEEWESQEVYKKEAHRKGE